MRKIGMIVTTGFIGLVISAVVTARSAQAETLIFGMQSASSLTACPASGVCTAPLTAPSYTATGPGYYVLKDATTTQSLSIVAGMLTLTGDANGTGITLDPGLGNVTFLLRGSTLTAPQIATGTGIVYGAPCNTTGVPGAATCNQPAGRSAVAAGQTSVTITDSLVSATSIILVTPQALDATCLYPRAAVPGAGSFTFTMGPAACTAAARFSWVVHN